MPFSLEHQKLSIRRTQICKKNNVWSNIVVLDDPPGPDWTGQSFIL